MQSSVKKRIGILRGGKGKNYKKSVKEGGDLILYISENLADKYKPVDIFVDKDYLWHLGGVPVSPSDLVNKVDVVWNTSHPSLSNILESLYIPNVGANSFSHSLEHNSDLLREHVKKIGMQMPRSLLLPVYQEDFDGPRNKYAIKKAKDVFEKFGSPWVVKAFGENSNMGIHVAKTFNELVAAIEDGLNQGKSILVEELIPGKVAPMHSLASFRGEDVYVFPCTPLHTAPINFSQEEKAKLAEAARILHKHLGATNYLKSNFLLNSRGKVYLLGVESLPNLRPESHFCQACESIGLKAHNIVEHIIKGALR